MRVGKLLFRRFRKYMVQNIVLFLLLCIVMVPVYTMYYNQSSEKIIKYRSNALNSSMSTLNTLLTSMESLINNTCKSQEVQLLALKTSLSPSDYLTLNTIYSYITSIVVANDLLSDIFILMHNNSTVISNVGTFTSLAGASGFERFSQYYHLSDAGKAEILDPNRANRTLRFFSGIALPRIEVHENETSFFYSMQMLNTAQTTAIIVFSRQGLNELFDTEWGQIALYGFNNEFITTLPDSGDEVDDSQAYYSVQSESYTRVNGILRITSDAYKLTLQSVAMTIILYGSLSILASLILSAFSAYRSCKPIRLMINKLIDYGFKPNNDNEIFNYFFSSMDDLHQKHRNSVEHAIQLRKQLDQSLIEQYLRTPTVLMDGHSITSIEKFPQKYVVCYVMIKTSNSSRTIDEDDNQFLITMVSKKIMNALDAILVLLDETSFALILSVDSDNDRQIVRLHEIINEMADMNIPVSVVVSKMTNGLSNLNRAFENTRSLMSQYENVSGLHFSSDEGSSHAITEAKCKDSQLYNAIVTGNDSAAISLIVQLMSDEYGIAGLEQRYYYARMPLLLAQYALDALDIQRPPDYSSVCPPDWLQDQLCEFAHRLCQTVVQKFKSNNSACMENECFLDYIHNNFCNDRLAVKDVSEACGISEKLLNINCRISTGMNISSYIKQLRLDKASSMLRNTDTKVRDILKVCGYNTPNAFYKAFKKAYGISPSEYRNVFMATPSVKTSKG